MKNLNEITRMQQLAGINEIKINNPITNYDKVKNIIEDYNDYEIMEKFYDTFKKGWEISYEEYITFTKQFMGDVGDIEFIRANWDYYVNGNKNAFDDLI